MDVYELVRILLIEEDIEGLLGVGAPDDEYDTEAEMIADRVGLAETQSAGGKITFQQARNIIVDVWKQMFGISDSDIAVRMESIELIATRIAPLREN